MAELFLVEFKGSRKEYFYNSYYHSLKLTDSVIIQAERGEDYGVLTTRIEKEMDFPEGARPRAILRPATADEIRRAKDIRDRERQMRRQIVTTVRRYGLVMKVVDVELQFDGNKMTVFFTAEHRVDFRELVKELAQEFRTRIELRQIGVRDEARRVGGYGVCGKQQCCNSHLTEFAPITTQHAREQDLPLNPAKISGNCGRLLCCLRYEAEQYSAVKRLFPSPGTWVRTANGNGIIERIDYFREEAIVRGEEGTTFRAAVADIQERHQHAPVSHITRRDTESAGESRNEATSETDSESATEQASVGDTDELHETELSAEEASDEGTELTAEGMDSEDAVSDEDTGDPPDGSPPR